MTAAPIKDEMAEFREAFCMIDKDSDGFITVQELATVIHAQNGHHRKGEVEDMISEVVVDVNGRLDFEAFLNVMGRKHKETVAEELTEAFKVFDRNRDGYISVSELRQVMISLGERLTEEDAEQMIREADLDGDGQLSYEEFASIMTAF